MRDVVNRTNPRRLPANVKMLPSSVRRRIFSRFFDKLRENDDRSLHMGSKKYRDTHGKIAENVDKLKGVRNVRQHPAERQRMRSEKMERSRVLKRFGDHLDQFHEQLRRGAGKEVV